MGAFSWPNAFWPNQIWPNQASSAGTDVSASADCYVLGANSASAFVDCFVSTDVPGLNVILQVVSKASGVLRV